MHFKNLRSSQVSGLLTDNKEMPKHNPHDINFQKWNELYKKLDLLIKDGKHEEVRKILDSENPKNISRDFAAQFGDLAFRSHLPMFTLKVLHPYIHPENTFSTPATDREKMVYATAIFSLGAVHDSLAILNDIDPNQEPEANFYKALAHVCEWNYAGSIQYLQAYIESEKTPPYRKLVGNVNLAAAHVTLENWNLANQILDETIAECEKNSHGLLIGNCLEIKSQIEFYQGRYEEALNLLKQAAIYLGGQQGRYSMLVDKGVTLSQLFQLRQPENLKALEAFRARALELGHWDSIRDADLFEAIFSKDEMLGRKIIMGTPSEYYRQRVRKLFGENFKSNGQYWWYLGGPDLSSQTTLQFDPYQHLSEKPMLLNLFDALTCDFYKPANIGALFQKIYPDEKFNPFTSPSRTLQLLRRLDKYFVEKKIPLRVIFKKSEFQLTSLENIFVLVRRGKPISASVAKVLKLKDYFAGKSFTPAKASAALNVSKSSIHKVINEALADGGLVKDGFGRSVTYRFTRQKRMREIS